MTSPTIEVHGPEREVALDMAKLGFVVGPLFLIVATVFWQLGGLVSAALAFGIVVVNLLFGAWLIGRVGAISANLLMVATLAGFLVRLIALGIIVVPIRNLDWFEVVPFAITLVGGHLGLLAWETQRISGTLAYPGLAPGRRKPVTAARTRSKPE